MDKTDKKPIEQCPEFPHFGAWYPDARCIDGYLWDLDSSDGDGDEQVLTSGGSDPCPFCNTKEYIKWTGLSRKDALKNVEILKAKYLTKANSNKKA